MVVRVLPVIVCLGCADRIERILAQEGDPVSGAEVWGVHCDSCHATDGTGTADGPDLTDEPDETEDVADKILYGWGEMEGFAKELSNQEVADLLAYLEDSVLP